MEVWVKQALNDISAILANQQHSFSSFLFFFLTVSLVNPLCRQQQVDW